MDDILDVLDLQDVHDFEVLEQLEEGQQDENPDVPINQDDPNNHEDDEIVQRYRINPFTIPDVRF